MQILLTKILFPSLGKECLDSIVFCLSTRVKIKALKHVNLLTTWLFSPPLKKALVECLLCEPQRL